jgi:hypothetical protein
MPKVCMKADHGGGHAVAGVRVQVVGAEAGLHQLGGGIALMDGVLAGTEDGDAGGALLLQSPAHLLFHDVQGLFPGDGRELALLVELAVGHAQQRLGQTVLAVVDLAVEVALDAVQALVDRGVRVTLGGDDAAALGGHHDAAAGTAETTHALVPLPARLAGLDGGLGLFGKRHPHRGGGGSGNTGLQKITTRKSHLSLLARSTVQICRYGTGFEPILLLNQLRRHGFVNAFILGEIVVDHLGHDHMGDRLDALDAFNLGVDIGGLLDRDDTAGRRVHLMDFNPFQGIERLHHLRLPFGLGHYQNA